jgi:hypothetical protein
MVIAVVQNKRDAAEGVGCISHVTKSCREPDTLREELPHSKHTHRGDCELVGHKGWPYVNPSIATLIRCHGIALPEATSFSTPAVHS